MASEVVQIALFSAIVVAGLLWGRQTLRSWSEYSFSEDFKATFLRVRATYSGDLLHGGPRLIVPVLLVVAGLGLLVSLCVRTREKKAGPDCGDAHLGAAVDHRASLQRASPLLRNPNWKAMRVWTGSHAAAPPVDAWSSACLVGEVQVPRRAIALRRSARSSR